MFEVATITFSGTFSNHTVLCSPCAAQGDARRRGGSSLAASISIAVLRSGHRPSVGHVE